MIIGISGKKGAGKTTIAESVFDSLRFETSMRIMGFSCGIKRSFAELFNYEGDPEDLNKQEEKESLHVSGKTTRVLLQEYGVAMRDIWPDIWVEYWKECVLNTFANLFLVPDVRFPNEVKAIHDLGGVVIRLTRCPHPEDTHESETALDEVQARCLPVGCTVPEGVMVFDSIIDNACLGIDETNEKALEYVKGMLCNPENEA